MTGVQTCALPISGAAIIAYFSKGKPNFSFTINKVGVGYSGLMGLEVISLDSV